MKHYLVNRIALEQRDIRRDYIIYPRPTPWQPFLCAVVGMCAHLGYVLLPDEALQHFHNNTLPVTYLWEVLRINGDDYPVFPCTFWETCKFVIESFQYGYFLRFWRWRWR